MDLKFIVIEGVISDPTFDHGERCCADTCISLTDDGYMFVDSCAGEKVLFSQLHEFDIEHEGRRWHIHRIMRDVFIPGEIIVVDAGTGREVGGYGRKPSKWNVRYKEFGDIEEAAQYALDVIDREDVM